MKKFFEEPSIECIRLEMEAVASSTDLGSSTMGAEPSDDPDIPQG